MVEARERESERARERERGGERRMPDGDEVRGGSAEVSVVN